MKLKSKALKIAGDSVWSIAGLVLMNVVAQFAVYPDWNRVLGNENYGRVLYLLSAMNIPAISAGIACNYARMRASAEGPTRNRTYLRMLALFTAAALAVLLPVSLFSGSGESSPAETLCFLALAAATIWRFYADVEYRLSLNYRGYFLYYLVISCGYGAGIGLFRLTGLWPLALLPGELAGLALVLLRGRVLRKDPEGADPEDTRTIVKTVLVLFGTELINNVIYNSDRLLLNFLMTGTAVTVFYQASLLGKTMTLISTPLNSVIMGYLARTERKPEMRHMHLLALGALAVAAAVTAVCTGASHIVIRLLYPQNYDLVRGYFWIANLGQVCGFTANIVMVFLLRFGKVRYQLYVNAVFAALFAGLCIPGALRWGMDGFCAALLAAFGGKLLFSLALGYRHLARERREARA